MLRRALILDDDATGASALCELLRQSGWDAHWSNDGETMLLVAATFQPQLLLLDLDMLESLVWRLPGACVHKLGHSKP